MNELERIVADMESVFAESSYPKEFLAAYDQMECLATHTGWETFLVQRKSDGGTAVATCYDRSVVPIRPDISLLREVDHPGLPRHYEQYQNEQLLCVVREYIEGEPLNVYARDRQLSVGEIVSMAKQLCGILQVLHEHEPPIVHRDIKPENVIVKADGELVLIDFDIARAVKIGDGADTVAFGTRGYAPPEQYGFGQTDNRSDIYAFGVLLRWMVTGSVRQNGNVVIDSDLQRIIDRCTAFSPEQRYSEIGQVKQALERVGRRRRRFGPKKVAALILTAMLLLGAGFAAGRYTDWLQPEEKIVFTEPLIEQAARLWIGKEKGRLTGEDLSRVTRLYIYGTEAFGDPELFNRCRVDTSTEGPIRTLDDLALMPNLEEIHIVKQNYVDTSAVAGMKKLRCVELKHMLLFDVADIANVPRLREAILFGNRLSDVTALENCLWLETLDIGYNNITSLEQVGRHPNVKSLGLMWLKMDNVDDIAQRFPNMEALTLQYGHVKDLSGLKALKHLAEVYVLREQADGISALFEETGVQVNITEE